MNRMMGLYNIIYSWISHIPCSVSHSHMITQVCPVNSGVILSDHLPT